MARKPTDIINLKLRLPEVLRRRLAKAADRIDPETGKSRSMNAEIIHRLEQSFLAQNFSVLMRDHMDTAAHNAANMVKADIEKLVKDMQKTEGEAK